MDYALRAKLFHTGNVYVIYSLLIVAICVTSSVGCENEPSDEGCLPMAVSISEGGSVEVPLNVSRAIRDLCIWDDATARWENACHFSRGICWTLLKRFKEEVSIRGNKLELKNLSRNARGNYRLLDKPGNCVASIRVSILDEKPPSSGTSDIRLEKWSGVAWLFYVASVPVSAVLNYLWIHRLLLALVILLPRGALALYRNVRTT